MSNVTEITLDVDYEHRPPTLSFDGTTYMGRTGFLNKDLAPGELKWFQKSQPGKKLLLVRVMAYAIYTEV